MRKELELYIKEHQVCSDIVFNDWRSFLNVLYENGGAVNKILWFEYVRIDRQAESLGAGGYADHDNPGFMWAETMICDNDLDGESLLEITQHIEKVIQSNLPHTLVPCFCEIIA